MFHWAKFSKICDLKFLSKFIKMCIFWHYLTWRSQILKKYFPLHVKFYSHFLHFYILHTESINISCSVQVSSVAESYPTLCDPKNRSMLGLPVHHQLLEFTQTHVLHKLESVKPYSHLILCRSLLLQHQSFQWTPRTDLL